MAKSPRKVTLVVIVFGRRVTVLSTATAGPQCSFDEDPAGRPPNCQHVPFKSHNAHCYATSCHCTRVNHPSPLTILSPTTAGDARLMMELLVLTAGYGLGNFWYTSAAIFLLQMTLPVAASRHHMLPAQSGTYKRPFTMTGVAVTSEAAVKFHPGFKLAIFDTPRVVSA